MKETRCDLSDNRFSKPKDPGCLSRLNIFEDVIQKTVYSKLREGTLGFSMYGPYASEDTKENSLFAGNLFMDPNLFDKELLDYLAKANQFQRGHLIDYNPKNIYFSFAYSVNNIYLRSLHVSLARSLHFQTDIFDLCPLLSMVNILPMSYEIIDKTIDNYGKYAARNVVEMFHYGIADEKLAPYKNYAMEKLALLSENNPKYYNRFINSVLDLEKYMHDTLVLERDPKSGYFKQIIVKFPPPRDN